MERGAFLGNLTNVGHQVVCRFYRQGWEQKAWNHAFANCSTPCVNLPDNAGNSPSSNLSDLLSFSSRFRSNIVDYIAFVPYRNQSVVLDELYYF